MRNFTARGELKTTGASASTGAQAGAGTILAKGAITPLTENDAGIAALQALSVAEDLEGIALAQSPVEDVELALELAASELIPPRPITFTSTADLSAITFEIVGEGVGGGAQSESLAGPAGAPQDDDGIAASQAPTEDTPLALEAAAAALDPPRALTFTSSSDLSGVDFEIVGLDANGDPQTVAAFAGPDNTTVTTSERWSAITSITPDATSANALSVGWPDTAASVTSLGIYTAVESITPDASDAGQVEVGWQASAEAFPLVLGTSELDPPRPITLTSGDNLSGVSFELVGTDEHGEARIETLTGPNDETVRSAARFASITSITPQSLGSGSVSVGWPDDSFLLYRATANVEISHLYARNNGAELQTIDMTLIVDEEEVPWLMFDLNPDEVASVLQGQHTSLPLDAGTEIRVTITAPGAVSFTMHGRQAG